MSRMQHPSPYPLAELPPRTRQFMKIPETIILDAQKKAYKRKDTLTELRKVAFLKQEELNDANAEVGLAEQQLRETLDFLQEHNSDAHEDWYAELGIEKRSTLDEKKKPS